MDNERETLVARHYGKSGLMDRIMAGVEAAGLDPNALAPADLAPVDEFHMGGRAATKHFTGLLHLHPGSRVLDIGSGLGGLARFLASEHGAEAVGVDLTPEFVEIAERLSALTGLEKRTSFQVGSALDLPFGDESFDAATTFHVAMNIADRERMYAEAARVLRPGAGLIVYDVMKGHAPGMVFPTPWAETEAGSHLTTPEETERLLVAAGFEISHREDRAKTVIDHHRERLAEVEAGAGPPPLGLHLLQGENAAEKSKNMIAMMEAGQITLVGLLAEKR